MDIPILLEALSPSETRELAAALPPDVLNGALDDQMGQTASFARDSTFIERASPEMLKAELVRRGELPADIDGLIDFIEASLANYEDHDEDGYKRLIHMSQICVDAATGLRDRAMQVRGEVFYEVGEERGILTRRAISEIIPLSTARIQQVIEAKRKTREKE